MSHAVPNRAIAQLLREYADVLAEQGANPFRVRAYRHGADAVEQYAGELADLLATGGREALEAIPGIGEGLAAAIDEIVGTGTLRSLVRARGQADPEELFATIPGIGPELARRIHHDLEIDTLEELEVAAFDGSLDAVAGIGEERLAAVRDHVARALDRSTRRRSRARQLSLLPAATGPGFDHEHHLLPSVELLLAVDREYRELDAQDRLERIAPHRFNPEGRRWLPIWHTQREGFDLTLLYSNTARAHHLGKTLDWVVVYFERDGEEEQCTVVTETKGEMRGRRVVRGRESECRDHYRGETVNPQVRAWAFERLGELSAGTDAETSRLAEEVARLHAFVDDWFNGRVEHSESELGRFSQALAAAFVLVTPDAEVVPRDEIIERVRRAHGSRGGRLRIWTEAVTLRHHLADVFAITYEEWQAVGEARPRCRLSTALLRRLDSAPGGFEWIHVHETAAPTQ